jgi:hypothetical protein
VGQEQALAAAVRQEQALAEVRQERTIAAAMLQEQVFAAVRRRANLPRGDLR